MIEVGNKVRANWRGNGEFYFARVKHINEVDGRCTYDLVYDDGDVEQNVPSERVIGNICIRTYMPSH